MLNLCYVFSLIMKEFLFLRSSALLKFFEMFWPGGAFNVHHMNALLPELLHYVAQYLLPHHRFCLSMVNRRFRSILLGKANLNQGSSQILCDVASMGELRLFRWFLSYFRWEIGDAAGQLLLLGKNLRKW